MMFDSVSRSDPPAARSGAIPAAVRGDSEISVTFDATGGLTHIARHYERGALRLRYPRAEGRREAVLVNTGGGITGGDRLDVTLDVRAEASVLMTTQAAEKIYRSDGAVAQISTRLSLAPAARLDWLPQETLLFDGTRARRELHVEMSGQARLTILEALGLGRVAHGEQLRDIHWRDRWRIARDGRLLLAEDVHMEGDAAALMERAALGAGSRALATLVHIAPDAETRLPAVRVSMDSCGVFWGASAWNGMLVVRIAAPDLRPLLQTMARAAQVVTDKPMPRAWLC